MRVEKTADCGRRTADNIGHRTSDYLPDNHHIFLT